MKGKVVVITGASEGIGRALAIALARKGAKLVLAARNEAALRTAVDECDLAGGEAMAVTTDVTDQAQCKALIDAAVKRFGGVDVVVNNAGLSMWARFEEIEDLSIFDRIMQVNYLGAVYLTHFALPHLRRRNGLLVAVSSLTGKTGVPTRSAYAASKHAMQGFFDSLRIELRGSGVDVSVISPGFVATDIRAHALGPDGKSRDTSPREETKDTMSLEECVAIMVRAIERREREVVMTARARVGMWVKLVAPTLIDRVAERALRERTK